MKNFFELKKTVEKWMQECEDYAQNLGYSAAAENIERTKKMFGERELMVVVAGEARRGKSSLINALLNEKEDICPVDINVCTNVVTLIRYGREERIEAHIQDENGENGIRKERISRSQIASYVSEKENTNNYKNVMLLQVEIPNELLKEGVVFVDTPGVGSLNISHGEATFAFLPNADLLLFVTDAQNGMTETELEFLKRGCQYCANVVFPLTKKDLSLGYKTVASDNADKIHKELGIPMEKIQIIPVNSKKKRDYLVSGSRIAYKSSNYMELEQAIWSAVSQTKARRLFLPFIREVQMELLKVQDSLDMQEKYLGKGKEQVEVLTDALKKQRASLDALQSIEAKWRKQLKDFSDDLGRDCDKEISTAMNSAKDIFNAEKRRYSVKLCTEKVYTKTLKEVNSCISQKSIAIRDAMEQRIVQECNEIEGKLQLNMRVDLDSLQKIKANTDDDIKVSYRQKNLLDRLNTGKNVIGSGAKGASIGSTAGGIVLGTAAGLMTYGNPAAIEAGVVLGCKVGAAVGMAIGGLSKLHKSRYDQKDLETVEKIFDHYIAATFLALSGDMSRAIRGICYKIEEEFTNRLKRSFSETSQDIQRLENNLQLSQSELQDKTAAFQDQIGKIEKMLVFGKELEQEIGAA